MQGCEGGDGGGDAEVEGVFAVEDAAGFFVDCFVCAEDVYDEWGGVLGFAGVAGVGGGLS